MTWIKPLLLYPSDINHPAKLPEIPPIDNKKNAINSCVGFLDSTSGLMTPPVFSTPACFTPVYSSSRSCQPKFEETRGFEFSWNVLWESLSFMFV